MHYFSSQPNKNWNKKKTNHITRIYTIFPTNLHYCCCCYCCHWKNPSHRHSPQPSSVTWSFLERFSNAPLVHLWNKKQMNFHPYLMISVTWRSNWRQWSNTAVSSPGNITCLEGNYLTIIDNIPRPKSADVSCCLEILSLTLQDSRQSQLTALNKTELCFIFIDKVYF